MIGTAIGAGLSAVGSIFGGVKRARAARKAKRMLERQQAENKAWFDRAYNEDPSQRASTQQALTQAREMISERSKQSAGRNAVTGGSAESVAADKQANNQVMANATGQIAATADAQRQNANDKYQQMQAATTQQLANVEQQKANNISQATQGILAAAASASDGLNSAFGDKTLKKSTKKSMRNFLSESDKLAKL